MNWVTMCIGAHPPLAFGPRLLDLQYAAASLRSLLPRRLRLSERSPAAPPPHPPNNPPASPSAPAKALAAPPATTPTPMGMSDAFTHRAVGAVTLHGQVDTKPSGAEMIHVSSAGYGKLPAMLSLVANVLTKSYRIPLFVGLSWLVKIIRADILGICFLRPESS